MKNTNNLIINSIKFAFTILLLIKKGFDIMKYKETIYYIVETHFVTQGSNAYDLISDFIYNDIKKKLNDGSIFKKSA